MKDILFYLLIGIFIYYILSRFLERYSPDIENFDPSLVPVSSIVTLAKVAQKLVNGNSTLTSPSNLILGSNSSGGAGNLTVTGNSKINGMVQIGSTDLFNMQSSDGFFKLQNGSASSGANSNLLTVGRDGSLTTTGMIKSNITTSGNSTLRGYGQTIINGGQINIGNNNNTISIKNGDSNSPEGIEIHGNPRGILSNTIGSPSGPNLLQWNNDGVIIPNLNVTNQITKVNNWQKSSEGINRLKYVNNDATFFGTGPEKGYIWKSPDNTKDVVKINKDGNVTIDSRLILRGPLTYTGFQYPIDPCGYFKVRAYGHRWPLYYGWNFLWDDHDYMESVRKNQKWNGSTSDQFINSVNPYNELGGNSDPEWSARTIIIKPGFKATPYTYMDDGFVLKQETLPAGEKLYDDYAYPNNVGGKCGNNTGNNCNYRVHVIAVQLVSDTWALPDSFKLT